jgi:hypothetical protein
MKGLCLLAGVVSFGALVGYWSSAHAGWHNNGWVWRHRFYDGGFEGRSAGINRFGPAGQTPLNPAGSTPLNPAGSNPDEPCRIDPRAARWKCLSARSIC